MKKDKFKIWQPLGLSKERVNELVKEASHRDIDSETMQELIKAMAKNRDAESIVVGMLIQLKLNSNEKRLKNGN